MAAKFLQLLENIAAEGEQIEKELEGWTFNEIERKQGKKIVKYQETIAPQRPPKKRHSDLMESIIDSYFTVKSNEATANMLRSAWQTAIEETPLTQQNSADTLSLYMQIFDRLQPLVEQFYPNRASLATIMTSWRTPLKQQYGGTSEIYIQSIYKLGITQEESIKMKQDYKKSVRKSVREPDKAPKFTLEEVYAAIDKAAASTNPIDNIIAVQLSCGSRLVEVVKISDYMVTDDPYMIRIDKVAKDKNDVEDRTFIRPLLRIEADRVVEMVENIRSMQNFQQMTNAAATSKVVSSVNNAIKSYFKQDITSHKCRYLYASVAWQLYGKDIPQAEYIRALYGHRSADTTLTYLQYAVHIQAEVDEIKIDTKVQDSKKNINHLYQLNYPELANPKRMRLPLREKLQLLQELDNRYAADGIRMAQRDAKRYGFGSDIISAFWQQRT